jgi:hypothetical protein
MGVCIQVLRHLLAAKRDGVSYARTAMIGRQSLHVSMEQVQAAWQQYLGEPPDRAQTQAMLGDGFFEGILRGLGASRIEAVDYSAYEGATIVWDMNRPLPDEHKGQFTAVIDGGSLEHVFDFPRAVRNCMEMLAVGGHFLGITVANNFVGHGFYQFSPELYYRVFSPENGFRVEQMFLCETDAASKWHTVPDPQEVGARVTLVNNKPTFLMVRARKLKEKEVFASTPLQSDYQTIWELHAPDETRDGDKGGPSPVVSGAAERISPAEKSGAEAGKMIEELNVSLFDAIPSQTSAEDRLSLLGVQRAVRRSGEGYVYLEIGSHLGGSIQPHLLDPRCKRIYSIDKRPPSQPDARGGMYHYPDNSSARMLSHLQALGSGRCDKVVCFDSDARNVGKDAIAEKADLCFIDGEHTREAVISDFKFCQSVAGPNAAILFHDAPLLFDALAEIEASLRRQSVPFVGGLLRGAVYAIFLEGDRVSRDPFLHKMLQERRRYARRRLRQTRTPRFLQRPIRGVSLAWDRFLLKASPRARTGVIKQSSTWSDAVFHQQVDLHSVDRLLLSTEGVREEYSFRVALVGDDYESEYWLKAEEDGFCTINVHEFTVNRRVSDPRCHTVLVGGPKTATPVKVSLMFI